VTLAALVTEIVPPAPALPPLAAKVTIAMPPPALAACPATDWATMPNDPAPWVVIEPETPIVIEPDVPVSPPEPPPENQPPLPPAPPDDPRL